MSTSRPPTLPMRSVLTVPAIVPRFIEKAPESGADVVCLDLEDSVPPAEKQKGREMAAAALASLPPGRYGRFVRLNGPATGLLEDDLNSVVRPGLDGVILSKAESPDHILSVADRLTVLEREHGLRPGAVAIVPLIETARGVVRCIDICEASPRIAAAAFGAEDYATDMGIARTDSGDEVLWARTQFAVHCHAAGVIPIDTPNTNYSDEALLERDMSRARALGFRGKLCIHPAQVPIANRVFSPSPEEIAAARALVAAFEREGIAKGLAAIAYEGKMIDTPMYERAKRLLDWAARA